MTPADRFFLLTPEFRLLTSKRFYVTVGCLKLSFTNLEIQINIDQLVTISELFGFKKVSFWKQIKSHRSQFMFSRYLND
jgi:hypothetical protein